MIDNSQLRETIGINVKRLRLQRGLTQTELADRVGVTLAYIHRLEKGRSSPSAEVLFAIADSLAVKADELRQVSLQHA